VWSYFLSLGLTYKGAFFLPGVFEGNINHAVNGSIWSVLIEVWLYLILLMGYVLGILRSRTLFNIFFFVLLVLIWQDGSYMPKLLSGTTNTHVCLMFYIGSFLYINRTTVPTSPYYLLLALFLAGITIGTDRFPHAYVLVLVTFFCTASFSSQFAWMDRYGDYSYGVYLYGWPSQQVVALLMPKSSPPFQIIFSMCLALAMAVLSWHLIEKKALQLKRRFSGA
jgi:peptidoglycan/LPS O-acetylase OafA/YrhL